MSQKAVRSASAVCGGAQSLHTNGFDEALALPTAEAATLALRTQQIIAHESGAALTADPLAGSYYVEALTNELERGALELLVAGCPGHLFDRRDRLISRHRREKAERVGANANVRVVPRGTHYEISRFVVGATAKDIERGTPQPRGAIVATGEYPRENRSGRLRIGLAE